VGELNDYDDALTDNIATLQRLLASHQYEEALSCMDERMALITALTDFSRRKAIQSTEIATLVRCQLVKEQELRSQVDAFKNEIATQLVTLNRANKAKSSYRVNR
jgi:1,2-phenylacetyl-CoA epoxidase PaaB subunit